MSTDARTELAELEIADQPERWAALGFTIVDSQLEIGGITIRLRVPDPLRVPGRGAVPAPLGVPGALGVPELGARGLGVPGRGITGWTLRNAAAVVAEIDGLRTSTAGAPMNLAGAARTPAGGAAVSAAHARHPNGAIAVDHIVVITPDFERTSAALETAGMQLRRVRTVGAGAERFRQGFRRIGPAILELVETRGAPDGPAEFWGVVIVVQSLELLADRLQGVLGRIKPAVQHGRHIATLKDTAGLGAKVAFMDREQPARRDPGR